jgi:hypothetical protein
MAVTQDGSNKYGILTPTITSNTKGFIIESFSETKATNRVDLNDGNGEPLGAVIVPQREEASFTVQLGTTLTLPALGDEISYAPTGGSTVTYIITDVTVNETQEDFVRCDISAYRKTN